MRFFIHYLTLCVFNLGGVSALSMQPPGGQGNGLGGQTSIPAPQQTTTNPSQDMGEFLKPLPSADFLPTDIVKPPSFEMFPVYPNMETVQGGGTVRTYKLPVWADRVQYYLETEGRPLKASVNLWIGPIRTTHTLTTDVENGFETPISGTLTFKKNIGPVLKISTSKNYDLPIKCGVYVPNPIRAEELMENTKRVWANSSPSEKIKIQGGSTYGGGGAVRYWKIPANVKSVQLLGWSKDVGKKSFKLDIEVLQGPNNKRQFYYLQCGGSTQPWHGVIQTPGKGSVVRIYNNKFVEDGLVQVSIVPYETIDEEREGGDGFLQAAATQRG